MHRQAQCTDCYIDKSSIFSTLTPEEQELIVKHSICTNYKKNEIIFKEGDRPLGLVCLCKGKVKIFKEGIGSRDQIIRMVKSVGFIGFRAVFAEDNYIASAVAIDDCTISVIDKEMLTKLIINNSQFSLRIIKHIAVELGHSNERTLTLTQKHIRGRLAESLLFLVETFGYERDNKTIKVYLSREDIANLSNMTTSNAIRTLSTFAVEGVLKIDGRRISIVNLAALKKISSLG